MCLARLMQIYDTKLIASHPVPLNHPPHPRVATPLPLSAVGIAEDCGIDCLGVVLGKEIAGPLHPLTWPPQWAFVWSACGKLHPSSSNGFWSATGSIRHYCYAWVKPTDTQAGRRRRRRRVEVLHGPLKKAKPRQELHLLPRSTRRNPPRWR